MSDDLYIGLISGTSVDGIDAALVSFEQDRPSLVHSHLHPYPAALRQAVQALFVPGNDEIDRMGAVDVALGELFADAAMKLLEQAGVDAEQVRAIGCHGQTVRHRPGLSFTLQLANPHVIAERTGIDVVADFRRRDMAAGGQGAPLAPAFHRAFLADPAEARVVLNLGGIANITLLPTDGRQPLAFDTGPANGLMDAWINQCQGLLYDADGGWAASGLHDPGLLRRLLAEPYFRLPPPKSTGKELFHLDWLRQRAELSRYDAVTVQATLLELSVISVADAIAAAGPCERVLVCGGGAHNGALMAGLQARLAVPVQSTQAIGVDPDWVEAMAFAWLARCHVQGQMLDLSAFTGAHRPTILGVALPGKRKQTIV